MTDVRRLGPALWHDCTVLREFRGDAHIAAVAAAGFVWPEPHLLQGATVDPRQQEYRGWSDDQWAAADLDVGDLRRLVAALDPVARASAVQLPYPNAIGVDAP